MASVTLPRGHGARTEGTESLHDIVQSGVRNRAQAEIDAVELRPRRVRVDGRFFRLGPDKFWLKGVTYGPFAPREGSGIALRD